MADINPEARQRVTQPLATAWTLPPSAYTSPSIYQDETRAFLNDNWHAVARIEQISERGDFLSLDLLGQPIMVVHGQDDEIRVMSRVCLHRAAPVVEGTGNRFVFTCPYHAWSYDTAGNLKRAPMMEDADDFDETGPRLPQASVEIWNGFVMANFAEHPTALAPQLSTFTDYFAAFRLENMEIAKTIDYEHNWNWKVVVENFMEAYHHIGPHNQSLEPAYHARDSKVPDNDGPWSILHMPAAEPHHDGPLPPIESLPDWQRDALFANVIFPMFIFAVNANSMFWYQVLPKGPHEIDLKIHVCLPKAYRELPGYDEVVEGTAAIADMVHQEDIVANDQVWAGLTAPLTQQGRLSPYEKSIWQLNQWWISQLGLSAR